MFRTYRALAQFMPRMARNFSNTAGCPFWFFDHPESPIAQRAAAVAVTEAA